MLDRLDMITDNLFDKQKNLLQVLRQVDPRLVLNRGYSIVRDNGGFVLRAAPAVGANLTIENAKFIIETEVKNVRAK
jgi:exonuclease VII large subunit